METSVLVVYPVSRVAIFVAVGCVGIVAHYLKAWLRDQITGSIWKYLFVDQPKQTGYTVFTLASAAFTMYAAGQLPPDVNTLVFLAFTTGFTCDSVVNSGSPVAPISQETLNGDTQK